MPQVQGVKSSNGDCKNDWAKKVAHNVQNDQRQQPWKTAFGDETVNSKVTKETDYAVYNSAIPQVNGLAA
ncbi:hypothetical protein HO133_004279 [Letharia lupina]|uniref:Uncharacterized protein n=1 Tax=Letharia lupina TaxID=560253 RepID=A0A8H6FK24_9LECA|nr:uncharacterized protein HO133_004279 [Letharia lupina]KAF6229942.1 hypothetical protein HO133_004279 [Letharia lupina]